MSFGDILWFILISFAFFAYLIVLFNIIGDMFRDHEMSGWVKALWIVLLIFLPFVTALVYLIVRGRGMAERQAAGMQRMKEQQDAYIKQVATGSTSPADEIASAKQLLDSGAITQQEFDALKAKALQ
ncbi:MAG: SHOCT domain-containing protein [Candidatus Nanopelagicales bacterium]